ncbi:hypothetical protein PBY51_015618 [Eleginops maclovinus]|uniref:Uncharacterized protein n=1 Tax=Eleginops maclovinus TaxID=56733 RepID=A0AAN8AIY5_ELEMC|nr:hypothetical protein PBY51_015618 [Eleginops maclovinus]
MVNLHSLRSQCISVTGCQGWVGAKWDINPSPCCSCRCHKETNGPRGSVLSVTVSASSWAAWPPVSLLSRLFAPFGGSGAGGGVCPGQRGVGGGPGANEPQRKESDGSPAQTVGRRGH